MSADKRQGKEILEIKREENNFESPRKESNGMNSSYIEAAGTDLSMLAEVRAEAKKHFMKASKPLKKVNIGFKFASA